MFKPFIAGKPVAAPARHVKLAMPSGNEAIVLQVAPGDMIDLSAIADRPVTMVRLDTRLILLFENKGHIVLEGALTADGLPVDGIMAFPGTGSSLALGELLAGLGPLHSAEILTQAGISPASILGSALAPLPFVLDPEATGRRALDLLGDENFGRSLLVETRGRPADDLPVSIIPTQPFGANDDAGAVSAQHVAGKQPMEPGQPTASGNVLANDSGLANSGVIMGVGLGNNPVPGSVGQAIVGRYGTLVLGAEGGYRYTLDATDADTLRLAAGETAEEVFTYVMGDGGGQQASATLTITVSGGNDGPMIVQGGTPQISEGLGPILEDPGRFTGTMVGADPDQGDVLTFSGGGTGQFGDLVMEASGQWTYTPRDGALDTLGPGETRTETFGIVLTDLAGVEAHKDLVLTIRGANDPVVIDLDTRDDATRDYLGYFEIEAAISDAFAPAWYGVEIVQVSSANGVAHLAITDPDGGTTPIRLVIDLANTRMGDPGFLQVDPAILAQFGASVTGDGTGRIVLETGQPLSADAMTTLLAAIRYFNTEATFLMDNADREITVTAIHDEGQVATAKAFIPVIAYVDDSTNLDAFTGTRFSDIIFGLDGDNVIDGGSGHDQIETGDGNNRIYGGRGRDTIITGSGDDRIDGGDGSDTIYAGAGADEVSGGGGDDEIEGEDGDDTIDGGDGDDYVNGGDGDDLIAGGDGDDSLDGWTGDDLVAGGDGDDSIFGDDGNDILRGDAGNDWIMGEAGDDVLEGGSGEDFLVGGTGDDRIDGGDGDDSILVRIEDGFDSHIDGGAGTDTLAIASDDPQTRFSVTLDGEEIRTITLTSANLTADIVLTDALGNRNVRGVENFHLEQFGWPDGILDFSSTQTAISIDLDVRFERMVVLGEATGFSAIAGFKDVIGGSGDDTLVGDDQNNEFRGGAGSDRIETGGGIDTIRQGIEDGLDILIDGGSGGDTLIVESDHAATRFVIDLDANDGVSGLELISSTLSQEVIVTDAAGNRNVTNVERIVLEQLGAPEGVLDFSSVSTTILVDFGGRLSATDYATGVGTVYGFNHAIGGQGDDRLFGDEDSNRLEGRGGSDYLIGGGNADILLGGDGNDVFRVSIGDGLDTLIDGGSGRDMLVIDSNQDSTRFAVTLEADNTLSSARLITATTTETLIATDATGRRNVEGVEIFRLENTGGGMRILDFSGSTSSIDLNLGARTFGHDAASNIHIVVGFNHVIASQGDDRLTGDANANRLEGGAGNDWIVGGGGTDFLHGDDGDDVFLHRHGEGRDSLILGGAGTDTLIVESDQASSRFIVTQDANGEITRLVVDAQGSSEEVIGINSAGLRNVQEVENVALRHLAAGDGTLDFSGMTTAVDVDLDGPLFGNGKGTATGFSEVVGFRNVIGGAGNDSISGDERDNILEGGAGNDYMIGYGGSDILYGGDGQDALFGGQGTDRIYGGAGNDILSGLRGDDVLDGGEGDDRLIMQFGHSTTTGGSGADQFFMSLSIIRSDPVENGNHVITDFNAADGDAIYIDAAGLSEPSAVGGASTGTLAAERFVGGTAFTDTTQRFLFNSQDNTLYYDADGAGAASDMLAVCRLTQGTLDSSMINIE